MTKCSHKTESMLNAIKIVENEINCCHSFSHPYLRSWSGEIPKMDINKVYWAAETATKLKSILTEKKVKKADTPISLMVENNNKNGEKIPQIYHSITSKNGKFIGCKNNEYIVLCYTNKKFYSLFMVCLWSSKVFLKRCSDLWITMCKKSARYGSDHNKDSSRENLSNVR